MIFCFRTFFPINHGRQHFVFLLTLNDNNSQDLLPPDDKMGTSLIISLSIWSLRVQVKDWGKELRPRRFLDWLARNKHETDMTWLYCLVWYLVGINQSWLWWVFNSLPLSFAQVGRKKKERKKQKEPFTGFLSFLLLLFFLTLERACLNIKKLTMAFFLFHSE